MHTSPLGAADGETLSELPVAEIASTEPSLADVGSARRAL
jgi:hypothetical protein